MEVIMTHADTEDDSFLLPSTPLARCTLWRQLHKCINSKTGPRNWINY